MIQTEPQDTPYLSNHQKPAGPVFQAGSEGFRSVSYTTISKARCQERHRAQPAVAAGARRPVQTSLLAWRSPNCKENAQKQRALEQLSTTAGTGRHGRQGNGCLQELPFIMLSHLEPLRCCTYGSFAFLLCKWEPECSSRLPMHKAPALPSAGRLCQLVPA